MPAGTVLDETMGVKNGSVLLKDGQQETERCWLSRYRELAHYFSLLCFLLVIVALLQTLCLVQITLVFRSQSTLQETKLRDATRRLEKLNQSYHLLFSQYPALNQYCPVSNSTTGDRACRPCPAGWTPQGHKCFQFSVDRADWISSQYRCMALGGAVATVRTEEEQVFLLNKAQSLSQGDSYWLGLRSSSSEEGWQWSDGSPVEKGTGFWEREPDNTENRELCGRLTPGGDYRRSWFSYRCSNLLRRICERRQATLQHSVSTVSTHWSQFREAHTLLVLCRNPAA
ncbi:C-type lectin domain family 1 member A-like [Anoplopoma fimbria]|uniref:C-type lectin domain family 1 member A-like n=1 Tax=Anoplopoma fimbria TaxID=229290 RepID=UPI0023ED5DF0|nr:C-type lectin domain family 1 member A-like [Anoplopoma fimbria]